MEQTEERLPAYAWINLLGLEIPIAAVLWSMLFCQLADINTVPLHLFECLFAAAWVAVMGTRIIHVLNNPGEKNPEPELQFVKSNWIILSLLTIIALFCGAWMLFFELGIGLISYVITPFIFCVLYLEKGKLCGQEISKHIFGALAFASAIPVPAFFYSLSSSLSLPFYLPNPQAFLHPSLLCLAGFVCLISLCEASVCREEGDPAHSVRIRAAIPLLTGILIFWIIYQMTELTTSTPEFWLFASIGAGTALIFYLYQINRRFSCEAFHAFSRLVLIIPVPLTMLMAWSPL